MNEPILVVDDIEDWRDTVSGLLEEEGYLVKTASSMEEALTLLETVSFCLAVLDVRLDESDEGNRDGLELMHKINRLYPTVRVIILTGYADVAMVQEALQPDETGTSAAFGFIQKTEMEDLLDSIRRAAKRPPKFVPSQECEITLTLTPGERLSVRARGDIGFADTSTQSLTLRPDEFAYWADEGRLNPRLHRALVKRTGKDLYKLLFEDHPSMQRVYQLALGRTSKKQYLHIVFETNRDLLSLPVEFLHSEDHSEYLVLLHPFIRQIQGVTTRKSPITAGFIHGLVDSGKKIRVLILTSNTEPSIPLIDEMAADLRDLLLGVPWIDLTYVDSDHATAARAAKLLRRCEYHIVHYIGHGMFEEGSPEKSHLVFWKKKNRSGGVERIFGNRLRLLLQDGETSLFHLTCCQGTQSGGLSDLVEDDYLGIADSIIKAGVPSVLGYRWPVCAMRAKEMVEAFYKEFLKCGSPQFALLHARKELAMQDKDDLTWLSPMLIIQS
jgi:CheY-like chemotaxis protein